MNKNELRNTILSQIQLPCIGKNRMQVEPVSGQDARPDSCSRRSTTSAGGEAERWSCSRASTAPVRCT